MLSFVHVPVKMAFVDDGAGSVSREAGPSAAAMLRHRLLHNIHQDFVHHG